MKNTILLPMLLALVLTGTSAIIIGCGGKTEKQEQTTEDQPAEAEDSADTIYACPMHPEITGKKGDVCSKCNMALEEVKKEAEEGEEHDH